MTIRVMTYNVRYFAHVAALKGLHSTRKGMRLIGDAVARLEPVPHVVCLQEVETRSLRSSPSHDRTRDGQTQLEAFMAALDASLEQAGRRERFRGYYFPAHEYKVGAARIYTTGLAILVRSGVAVNGDHDLGPHDITHRRFTLTAKLKQSRVCAHLEVEDEASGARLDVFNTHLSLPSFLSKRIWSADGRMGWGENQVAEAEALARFVEARAASDRFVVVGDFNAHPGSPVYTLLEERLGVRDAFAHTVGATPDELRLAWPTCGFLHLRMRLDHFFAGAALEGQGFEDTHRFGDRAGRWHGLSDHVPIVGRLAVR